MDDTNITESERLGELEKFGIKLHPMKNVIYRVSHQYLASLRSQKSWIGLNDHHFTLCDETRPLKNFFKQHNIFVALSVAN